MAYFASEEVDRLELLIRAWAPGLKKVSLAHLFSDEFGMTLACAKAVVDLILQRSDFIRTREGNEPLVFLSKPVPVAVPAGLNLAHARILLEGMGLVVEA